MFRDRILEYSGFWKKEERPYSIALMACIVTGTALRLCFLFQPMMHDEAATYVYFASRPLSVGLSFYPYPNNHLFHTMMAHFSTKMLGNHPWAVRLPAFIAGILIIPATYIVVRRLFNNRNAAIMAASLVAVSSYLVFFSVSARGYTIQALIFLVLILVAIDLLRRDRLSGWIAFVVLSALGFYTVPTMIYLFGGIALWMLLSSWLGDSCAGRSTFIKKLVLSTIIIAILVVLLYLPVFLDSGLEAFKANGLAEPLEWSSFARRMPVSIGSIWKTWHDDIPLLLTLMLGMGFIASIVFHKRIAKNRVNLALVTVGWCAVTVAAQRVVPFVRVWIPLMPLYFGFASAGLCYVALYLGRRLRRSRSWRTEAGPVFFNVFVIAVTGLLAASVLLSQSPYQPGHQITFQDAEQVALVLKEELKTGDIVYLETNVRKSLEYYFLKSGISMEYIYGMMGQENPDPDSIERAFVIDVRQKRFPMEKTMKYSGLDGNKEYDMDAVYIGRHSTIYLVTNLHGD